jgi:hypothetical protein
VNVVSERLQYQPDLRLLGDWRLHGAEGIEIASAIADRRKAIRMTISHEGEARLFACAGARYGPGRALAIFEKGAAGNLTSFLSAAGAFYSRAGYVGQLDTGVALTGVRGGVAHHEYQRASGFPFPADDFRSTGRFVALELVERPRDVAMQLLRRFLDAIVAFGYEPGV